MRVIETSILIVGEEAGKRVAQRHPLTVPVHFARSQWGKLSDRALNDLIKDLRHEQMAREGGLFKATWDETPEDVPQPRPRWNPANSQITEDS